MYCTYWVIDVIHLVAYLADTVDTVATSMNHLGVGMIHLGYYCSKCAFYIGTPNVYTVYISVPACGTTLYSVHLLEHLRSVTWTSEQLLRCSRLPSIKCITALVPCSDSALPAVRKTLSSRCKLRTQGEATSCHIKKRRA